MSRPQLRLLASRLLITALFMFATAFTASAANADRVHVAAGKVEGAGRQSSGVRIFRGIPFAQPPLGNLRWQAPQPLPKWKGTRPATQFGPRCTQHLVWSDMVFRSNGMSEDCLYLNVWTPAQKPSERLPVLLYFYGGGFVSGDSSEPRYDGESLAARGLVVVTANYRVGIFGFLAHPELTKESPHNASGNYGLLDQNAALQWVVANIAAFGGDPKHVTIAGESAGSVSVSAQMVSPLSQNLIAGAIGESGSIIATLRAVPLAEAEQKGVDFATKIGTNSLTALRALTTQQLLEATSKSDPGTFPPALDGYFLPEAPLTLFSAGKQAHVPLLVGWNSEEGGYQFVLAQAEPTPENYVAAVQKLYGDRADEALKLYPGTTRDEVIESATDLATDRFIAHSTWKWFDLHVHTGASPVYRYYFSRPRPALTAGSGNAPPARGAVHSAEIEYALGNLATNKVYAWTPEDFKLSELMQSYFANFVKTGDPNGPGLPSWPSVANGSPVQVMHLDVSSGAEPEKHRDRQLFLDRSK